MPAFLGQFSSLRRSRAASDLAITFGSRAAQLVFALVGNVISARTLGPADFGRFGLVMGTVTIAGTIADVGLTFAAVRFIAKDRDENRDVAHTTARTYLALRVLSGFLVALTGVLLAGPLAAGVLGQQSLTAYLQLGFLILVGLSISSYPGTVLTGLARFDLIALGGVLNAIITFAGIGILLAAGSLNLDTLILWNIVLPLVSTLPIWFLLPADWRPWHRSTLQPDQSFRTTTLKLVRLGKWTAASNVGATIAAQLDIILLGRISGPATVGVYTVAVTLASRLDILNQSLFTIMMPRASRLGSQTAVRGYIRRLSRASVVLAAGLVVAALLAQPLILLLYGERYAAASPVFLVLLLVIVSDLFTTSLSLVAFPLNKPHILAFIEWIRVAVMAALGWPLIGALGSTGAALSRVASRAVSALYITTSIRSAVRDKAASDADTKVGAADAC